MPEDFFDGAVISLFLFWGWDISLNLAEETRNGHRASGLGAVLAMLVLIAIFTLFHVVALVALDQAQIAAAGTNLIFAIADTLFPRPWSLLAILVVMLSTVGALATTTLGFSRTLFAKSRHGVMHPRWQQLHPRWNTPHQATLLFAALGAALLLLSLAIEDVAEVLRIAITAVGLQAAFYYGLTGYACAWAHRKGSSGSPLQLLLTVIWPAASATALWGQPRCCCCATSTRSPPVSESARYSPAWCRCCCTGTKHRPAIIGEIAKIKSIIGVLFSPVATFDISMGCGRPRRLPNRRVALPLKICCFDPPASRAPRCRRGRRRCRDNPCRTGSGPRRSRRPPFR